MARDNVKLSDVKKVFRLLLPYWWLIILMIAATIITVWAQMQLPSITGDIVNKGIVDYNQSYIWQRGLIMLGVVLIGAIGTIANNFLGARVAAGFASRLRLKLFKKIESFSKNEIDQYSTASLITRSTNDIQQIQQTVAMLRMALQSPIMAVSAVMLAMQQAPSMSWIMWVAMTFLVIMIVVLFIVVTPRFSKIQTMTDQLNLVSRENLTGLRIVRAFHNEKYEERKFANANTDVTELALWINRVLSVTAPLIMLLMSFTSLAITWFFARGIVAGSVNLGEMVSFPQYAIQAIISFMFIAMLMIFIPRAGVSIKRVGEVLGTNLSIDFARSKQKIQESKRGQVEFRSVTFSYPNAEQPTVNNVSFVAKPGQTTAFIGSTGSGKSTLVNLISRFYDVTSGEVSIGGINIKSLAKNELDDALGYVPQRGVLFSGTVESNIKYGASARRPISDADMKRAAEIASANFINDLDGKFQAHIAQGGGNVSGGQKQRLSIARAVAKNPDILIFDDSFSALDYATDRKVRNNLTKFATDKTVLIVAQRIGTIRNADQILVIDNGEIVGRGTHYELLNNNEFYREIAASQLSEDEMANEMKLATAGQKPPTKPQNKPPRSAPARKSGGIAMIRRTYKPFKKGTN